MARKGIEVQITQLEEGLIELDLLDSMINLNVFFTLEEFESFRRNVEEYDYARVQSSENDFSKVHMTIELDGKRVTLRFDDEYNHSLLVFTRKQWDKFAKVVKDFKIEETAKEA